MIHRKYSNYMAVSKTCFSSQILCNLTSKIHYLNPLQLQIYIYQVY